MAWGRTSRTISSCPAAIRHPAIGAPIVPVPTNPMRIASPPSAGRLGGHIPNDRHRLQGGRQEPLKGRPGLQTRLCALRHNVIRYRRMIVSFRDTETARILRGERSRHLPSDIQNVALRKLRLLNQSRELNDLRVPPGNRLEALKGDRSGQYSIRINDQWRIRFVWTAGGPKDVEIVDYHR